jgi:O-antigen ligase
MLEDSLKPDMTVTTFVTPTLAATATWCAVAFYLANPLAALVLLLMTAISAYLLTQSRDTLSAVGMSCVGAFFFWIVLSVFWAPDSRPAWAAVALFAAVLPAAWLGMACAGQIPAVLRRPVALAFMLALAVGSWIALEEALTNHVLRRSLNTYVPLTRPRSILSRAESGWILELYSFVTNKSVAALVLLMWPALLIRRTLLRRSMDRWLCWATVAALAYAVWRSDHETSKLAMVVSGLVFIIALWSHQTAFRLVAFGWIAATILVLPAALLILKVDAHKSEQVQYSGRHRLVIWGHTAERVLKKPIVGYGIAATRVVDETEMPQSKPKLPGTEIPVGTNVHSHNMFLQVWHELGGVGALLMMLAGVPVLAWLRSRSSEAAPYHLAGFTAAVCIASLSWSLVAVWFIASFGLTAAWIRFADVVATAPEKQRQPMSPDKAWV